MCLRHINVYFFVTSAKTSRQGNHFSTFNFFVWSEHIAIKTMICRRKYTVIANILFRRRDNVNDMHLESLDLSVCQSFTHKLTRHLSEPISYISKRLFMVSRRMNTKLYPAFVQKGSLF